MAALELTDEEFLRQFEDTSLPDDAFPHRALAEKVRPQRSYSEETLWSAAARAGWVEPDLAPLP